MMASVIVSKCKKRYERKKRDMRKMVRRRRETGMFETHTNKDLDGVLISEDVDDFEGVFNNTNSHQFLSVVPAVEHQRVGKPLNNGALCLPETPGGIASSSVGKEVLMLLLYGDVILKKD